MNKRKQYYIFLFGMFFMVLLFSKQTLVVQAASQSITMTVGTSRSINETSYSEGSKTWTVSDSSVIHLMNTGSNTSRVLFADKVGSATVTIKTVYTVWEPAYNASTGMWISTPVSKTSYFTYYVTVVEEAEVTPPTINTIDDNYCLLLSSKTCVVTGTIRDTLSFESSNPSVISVDGHGVLFAKKIGSATITITDPYGATKEVTVIVGTQEGQGYIPISSIEELKAIPSGSDSKYYLTEDLDFTDYSDSFSITSFKGTFDGAGHIIKGYKNSTALFSNAQGAIIQNLVMQDAVIDGKGNAMAAIVCTGSGCTISNCHTLGGKVENTTNAGGILSSPIAAYNSSGKIEFCTNSASVKGYEVAGGIAGHTLQQIYWCTNKGEVATTNTSYVTWGCAGGIVGLGLSEYNSYCSYYYQDIRYCFNEGNIQSVTAGGIAGRLYGSTLSQCCNKGKVSSLKATLSDSRFTTYGTIGGILGLREIHYNAISSCIKDCYNQGNVVADDTTYPVNAGGIVGNLTLSEQYKCASIENTYSIASVTHTMKRSGGYRGGIAGNVFLYNYCGYTVKNSYTNDSVPVGIYRKASIGSSLNQTSCVMTLSLAEQYSESNYLYFDFGDIWSITPDGSSLPYLAIEDKAYNALNYIALHKHSFNEQGICEDEECGMISIDKNTDIEITPIDVTYSGEEQTASVKVTYKGKELTADTDYEVHNVKVIDAGIYDVVVTGKGKFADSKIVTWKIRQRELIPSITGMVHKSYDGTKGVPENHTLAVSLAGIVQGDCITATAEFTYDDKNTGTEKTVTANNVTLEGDDKDNYCLSTTTVSANVGTIEKAETSIVFKEYNPDMIYTGKPLVNPTMEQLTIIGADYQDVIFIWYKDSVAEENKLTKAPTDAGTYVLVASIPETMNTKASSVISEAFTIAKADPEYTKPTDLMAVCGDTLSSVSLEGTGFSWEDDTIKLKANNKEEEAIAVECTAVYTPVDTQNYNTLNGIPLNVTVAHDLSAENIEEGKHASKCKNKACGFQNDSVDCSGGEANCGSKAVCAVCNKEYGEINPANHKWDSGTVTKAATCIQEGEKILTCQYDKNHTKTESIAIDEKAHDYGSWLQYDKKQHKRICKNDSEHIDYADHEFGDWKVVKVATEQTEGVETKVCKGCGYTENRVIEKILHQHTFVEKIDKAATASEDGSKHEECSTCGYKKQSVSIPATGVPEPGTSLKDAKSGDCYTVVNSEKKQVKYTGPINKNAKQISIPLQVKVDGITYTVTEIGKNAFTGCKKLTKVTIGKNVKTIGANAFSGCSKLKTLSMGNNVTTIGDKAFYKCTTLNKVTIPSKVTKIGKQAFYGCKKLKTITIKTTKLSSKKVGSKAFKGIYSKATVKVPKSKLTSYKRLLKAKGVGSKAKIKK